MDRNVGSFTVLFQPPFWVGIAERWGAEGYSAARVVFGPEPTDAQIYQWLEREWHRLNFSPAAEGERPAAERKNECSSLVDAWSRGKRSKNRCFGDWRYIPAR